MKHIFRKSLALLLTMAMLLGMFTGLVAVQTTTASAADAEIVEIVTADEFWEALEKATASRKPTVIKLMANVSAIDTITDHSPYPHLQWAVNYPKAIVPNNCQIDLNGKILTIRGIVTAAQFLPKADTLIDATGKGSVKVYIWNAVAASTANGIAMANRSKFVTTLQITTAINQKNADYVIPSGVTLTGTAGVTGSRSLTFKSGAICSSAIVRGTNGVIFECATPEDLLRTNIDKATVIRLMADIRAGDLTIGKNQTLDLNGHTLKCHTLTLSGKLTEKGGKVITGVDPYDLTPDVEAPANEPVADPMAEPANAQHYYVLDYIQSDGIDDYIDTGIVPTRYMRTDMEAEMANLVEGAIFGSTYTQSSVISDNGKSMYYSVGLNADGSYYYRYNVYTSWKFNRTGLEFTGKENKRTSGDTADPYVFPEHTRGFFRANYWLTNVSSSNTKITAEMIPYGSTESHQVDVKTSTGNVNTFFGKYNVTMYLFANHEVNIANNTEETNRFAPARLYSMQVYDSNGNGNYSIRASFLPVINENGETGLLDLVSGEFFGNKGSGVFKRGPVLGEIAVGDADAPWFTVSSGAEAKVRAASVDSLAAKVRVGNPEKPVILSMQYPELADTSRWSYPAMSAAVRNELMKGDSKGKLNLTGNLTRAEAATIITRAFGATESASIANFSDVVAGQWYVAPMSRAVYMGVINGSDGKLLPNSPITREQVFTILARALDLPAYSAEYLDKFADGKAVSDWAKESVAAMVEMGFVNGSEGKLLPKNYITREQFAQVMYNLFKTYIQSGELYVGAEDGGVIINTSGVTLQDVETNLVVVGDGAANGDVTLQNVKTDLLVVRGGGLNTVYLKNSSAKKIIISKPDGGIRVKADGGTNVEEVLIDVEGISGAAPKGEVIFEGATNIMNVAGKSNVMLQNATVQQLNVDLGAKATQGANTYIAKTTTYVEPAAVEPEKQQEATPSGGGGGGGSTAAETHVHSFKKSTTPTKEPTCTESGYYTDWCTCGKSTTRTIPALGHDYTGAKNALLGDKIVQYCTHDCGEYQVIRDATADEIFTVEATKTELVIGETAQITVKNGEGAEIAAAFAASENVTVTASGEVTATAAGEATVTVTVSGLEQKATFTVLTPAIDGKTSETLSAIGATATLAMTNAPLNVTWASSDEKVATVKDGVVTAVANGKATITAAGLEWTVTVDAPIEVSTVSELVTAVNLPTSDGYNTTVVLAADLTETTGTLADITVPAGKTLDLSGHKLTLERLRTETGATVTTDDKTEIRFVVDNAITYLDAAELASKNSAVREIILGADIRTDSTPKGANDGPSNKAEADLRWTYAKTKYNTYEASATFYVWAGVPAGVTLDLNGYKLTVRAVSSGFGTVTDNSTEKNGTLEAWGWDGTAASVPNAASIMAEETNGAPNKRILYTNTITAKNENAKIMTIAEGTTLRVNPTFNVTLAAGGGYVFKTGATLSADATAKVVAPAGIVFECANLADLTREGVVKYATELKLVADIDATGENIVIPDGVTFNCNGYTLTCKTFSGPDGETFKTGDGGKVITESGEYMAVDRP
ncbi:MAG: S-layer homology domain-containing protein, partial [Oscillospiraceae bacterium]|nr:S-layer homology domain-containing protein [Oscillospiraceae bacterium]